MNNFSKIIVFLILMYIILKYLIILNSPDYENINIYKEKNESILEKIKLYFRKLFNEIKNQM